MPGDTPLKAALFIPCYIDQLYPQVGLATVRLLERHGVAVDFPEEQTCCGQPMANTGCVDEARPLAERFLRIFGGYENMWWHLREAAWQWSASTTTNI